MHQRLYAAAVQSFCVLESGSGSGSVHASVPFMLVVPNTLLGTLVNKSVPYAPNQNTCIPPNRTPDSMSAP
jgi:hypothetical protein